MILSHNTRWYQRPPIWHVKVPLLNVVAGIVDYDHTGVFPILESHQRRRGVILQVSGVGGWDDLEQVIGTIDRKVWPVAIRAGEVGSPSAHSVAAEARALPSLFRTRSKVRSICW